MKLEYDYTWAFACLQCRKSFKRAYSEDPKVCPNCGGAAYNLGRHFKPPKSNDHEQWEKVKFLIDHGFAFHKVYSDEGEHVPYPSTLREAKEFVKKHQDKAWFK